MIRSSVLEVYKNFKQVHEQTLHVILCNKLLTSKRCDDEMLST